LFIDTISEVILQCTADKIEEIWLWFFSACNGNSNPNHTHTVTHTHTHSLGERQIHKHLSSVCEFLFSVFLLWPWARLSSRAKYATKNVPSLSSAARGFKGFRGVSRVFRGFCWGRGSSCRLSRCQTNQHKARVCANIGLIEPFSFR